MAEWTRNKVDSDQLNGGQEYTVNSNVSREQLNSMVNAGLYAQDFAENLVVDIDTSDVAQVGTPSVEIVDGTGATAQKPYKKFKFSNLKGETGATPQITASVKTLSEGSDATITQGGTAEEPTIEFGIPKGDSGNPAGFGTVSATIDSNVGTPSVTVTTTGDNTAKKFNFEFKNMKGETGESAGFGTPTASVDANVGTPSVTVTASGADTSKVFNFEFKNLKGERGESGEIYQTTGDSKTGSMSQDATTRELTDIRNSYLPLAGGKIGDISTYGHVLTYKTWYGLTDFSGRYVWTDGDNIYYSSGTTQYELTKGTSTWKKKTWEGLTDFSGQGVWTDGDNIYYSSGTTQYELTKGTSTWKEKTWGGVEGFGGVNVWRDGDKTYLSIKDTGQYELNRETSTWEKKTWKGLTNFSGYFVSPEINGVNFYINNIYGALDYYVYILRKGTSKWEKYTPDAFSPSYGWNIWTDGFHIYLNDGEYADYIYQEKTNSWSSIYWQRGTTTEFKFEGRDVWTDGENFYISNGTSQSVLKEASYITDLMAYPIGSVFISVNSKSPAYLLGGTWEELPEGYALWTAKSGAGSTISAGLPNITGAFQCRPASGNDTVYDYSGLGDALYYAGRLGERPTYRMTVNSTKDLYNAVIALNASRSSSIYGNSTTVQPPAYKIYAWKRIS